jgi:hypothetical protein
VFSATLRGGHIRTSLLGMLPSAHTWPTPSLFTDVVAVLWWTLTYEFFFSCENLIEVINQLTHSKLER